MGETPSRTSCGDCRMANSTASIPRLLSCWLEQTIWAILLCVTPRWPISPKESRRCSTPSGRSAQGQDHRHGDLPATAGDRPTAIIPSITRINEHIAKLADGETIRYLNINDKLADEDGKLFTGMTVDRLHFEREGVPGLGGCSEATVDGIAWAARQGGSCAAADRRPECRQEKRVREQSSNVTISGCWAR